MSLREKIEADLKTAMVKKDETALSVLRLLKSAAHNQAIAKKKKDLSEEETLEVLSSQAKRRRESIAAFTAGGRNELAEKEKTELAILEKYLPAQASDDQIKKVVQEIVGQAADEKKFGAVMGQAMARLKGRVDGQTVARIVKEALAD